MVIADRATQNAASQSRRRALKGEGSKGVMVVDGGIKPPYSGVLRRVRWFEIEHFVGRFKATANFHELRSCSLEIRKGRGFHETLEMKVSALLVIAEILIGEQVGVHGS